MAQSLAAAVIAAVISMLGLLALASVFGACSSKKQLSVSAQSLSVERDSSEISATAAQKAGKWQSLLAFCDSLTLRFDADSLRQPDGGTVYRPAVVVAVSRPAVASAGLACESRLDSLAVGVVKSKGGYGRVDKTDRRDGVVVADTRGFPFWVFPLMAIVAVMEVRWVLRDKK